MSVTLQKNQASVTLPNPAPGYAARVVKRQAVGRALGGGVYAYDKGVNSWQVALAFESLTDTQKSALVTFFEIFSQVN